MKKKNDYERSECVKREIKEGKKEKRQRQGGGRKKNCERRKKKVYWYDLCLYIRKEERI